MPTSSTAAPRVASCSPPRLVFQTSGVDDTPLVSISVNRAWIEAVLSAMNALETPAAWVEATDYDAVETQLFTLYSMLVNVEDAVTLGTIATQNADDVDIDGGSIDDTVIGAVTPAAITGTVITSNQVVIDNALSPPLSILRDGTADLRFVAHSNTPLVTPTVDLRRGRGVLASPGSVLTGDSLGRWNCRGWDSANYGVGAFIRSLAAENFSPTAHGASLQFNVTALGSIVNTVAMTLHPDSRIEMEGAIDHDGTLIGLNGSTPVAKGTITGSRATGAALASLLTYLASRGDIIDSSTA